ncbi:MAG: DUF6090 family protein [Saprospiraceae bacterium]
MIKFFRNIRKTLLEKDKTTNYLKYAIGEIVLVVIGILLALQISEWNTYYKRHKEEVQLLEDIHKEFLENKEQLKLVKSYHMIAYEGTETLLNLMPIDLSKIKIDSIVSLLDKTYHNWTFNPQQSTINTLINTSSFDLISNVELRKLLQNWTDLYLDYTEDELDARYQVINFHRPYMIKHYETRYVKNRRPFEESNWDFLQSIEFKNLVGIRNRNLNQILYGDLNQLESLSQTIDKIIELTEQ